MAGDRLSWVTKLGRWLRRNASVASVLVALLGVVVAAFK